MSKRKLINVLEYIATLTIADLIIVLVLAYLLKIMLSSGYYTNSFNNYPNYFLGASSIISLLILVIIRLIIQSRILTDMIICMLPLSSLMIYADLFTRKGVNIEILPLVVIYSGNSHLSISPDLAQINLIIFVIYMIRRLTMLRRSANPY
ncbi:MAG: hypothetical protein ACP5GI_02285 [Sulfolobales archaeon]